MIIQKDRTLSNIDFKQIENSILTEITNFNTNLVDQFLEYDVKLKQLLKKYNSMNNPKHQITIKNTNKNVIKDVETNFESQKKNMTLLMKGRKQEIGCMYSQIPLSAFSSKKNSLYSPEMNIFSVKNEVFIDTISMMNIFLKEHEYPHQQFMGKINEFPQCLLFANFNNILHIFKTGLSSSLNDIDEQTALIFFNSEIFAKLFFFIQLFGIDSLHIGSKYIQSNYK